MKKITTPAQSSRDHDSIPLAPGLQLAIDSTDFPGSEAQLDLSILKICGISIGLAIVASFIAQILVMLINLVTNISFFGTFSTSDASPSTNTMGVLVIAVPIIGGLIVGVMARYGTKAIRGHGIPEAMEQVLTNESKINPIVTFLKPLSAAIAIGTGGPFGAEGPIIATGGALGSFFGQVLNVTASERKTLLTAGAAAGMTAIFGTPVAAILLSIELLLFEFRSRSIIPVALACVTAMGLRIALHGFEPVFPIPALSQPSGSALALYIAIGSVIGVCSVLVTKAVYFIEDLFEELPIHWMWWPAIGAIATGVIGYFAPRTLGVGYNNIIDINSGTLAISVVAILGVMKFLSWSISLGSGTSGGTMAPLFTIGGALGALLGSAIIALFPHSGVDIRIAALVGMASLFAGSSRALLASAVMAFEVTLQPIGLLPLIGACSASYLISTLLMKNSIMTEKIVRRGVRVPSEYHADFLDMINVSDVATREVVSFKDSDTLNIVREKIETHEAGMQHQGFPIVADHGFVVGVITRRDIFDPSRSGEQPISELLRRTPVCVYSDCTLREAADHMVNHDIGRLPVIDRASNSLRGIITRSDILMAHRKRINDQQERSVKIDIKEYIPRSFADRKMRS